MALAKCVFSYTLFINEICQNGISKNKIKKKTSEQRMACITLLEVNLSRNIAEGQLNNNSLTNLIMKSTL